MSGFILGLNGWLTRSHDASACIVRDGQVIAMVEEERFVRQKHAYDRLPIRSALWCLKKVNLTLDEIDKVAVGWDFRELYKGSGIREPRLRNLVEVYFPKKFFNYKKKPKIELVSHHLAHAASSFFLSGMGEASILVVDGQGEKTSTTFALGRGNKIKILWSLPIESSLGYFYEAVSNFIGFGLDAPGKTMGLASYGEDKFPFKQFKLNNNGLKVDIDFPLENKSLDQQRRIVEGWEKEFIQFFGISREITYKFDDLYGDVFKSVEITEIKKNIAASAQNQLAEILVHCVKILVERTKIHNLCLAGGVALNCLANTQIKKSLDIDNLFIPPFANDAGVSIGAALLIGEKKSTTVLDHVYLGPSYDDSEIKAIIDKIGCKYTSCNDIEEKVSSLLVQGKIVSWFQGSMEVGPRALGNRSILADPTLISTHRKVNDAKNREHWRPLAPSILAGKAGEYLEDAFESPFMLHTFNVLPSKQKKVPAIVHVDGSTRPQTVSEKINPRYHKLINRFEKLSGVPLILNTSFNGAREAIVCTPFDALASFFSNSTDCLAVGNFLIEK